ncbi:hypothetical protein BGW38_009964, partial [Lunasporangiospora selenospora]
ISLSNMTSQARIETLKDIIERPTRSIQYPRKQDGKPVYTSELFGENVFDLKKIANALPKPAYALFLKQMRGRQALDKATADASKKKGYSKLDSLADR